MSSPKRHVRLVLRVIAIGLLAVGAVLASSWFETLFHGAVVTPPLQSEASAGSPEAREALTFGIPLLLVGLVLLVLTRRRQQVLSLTRRPDDH